MIDPLQRLSDRYQVLREVRTGSLYEVRHRPSGDERLVRILRPPPETVLRRRIRDAARAVRRLDHPHVARLHDLVLDDEGEGLLVVELVGGIDLKAVIRGGDPLPLALVLEIARQSLDALTGLRAEGVPVFRISPAGLKLTLDHGGGPRVKLLDPGIAALAAATRLDPRAISRTEIRYASPEELQGEAGPQSVLYCFGLLLYELLTRRFPISGRSPSSILAGHLFRPPLAFSASDPRGRVPEDLRALVLRALAKEPGARFADAASLAAALAAVRRRHPVAEAELRRQAAGLFAGRRPAGALRLPAEPPADGRKTTVRLAAAESAAGSDRAPPTRGRATAALDEIEQLIARGDLPAAGEMIRRAEAAFGSHPRLEELRRQVEERARSRPAPRASAPAARLAPEVDRIRALLRRDPGAALRRLEDAVRRFGDRTELLDLRFEIVEASLEADGDGPPAPDVPAPGLPGATVSAAAPSPAVVGGRRSVVRDLTELTLTGIGFPQPAPEEVAGDDAAGEEDGAGQWAAGSLLDFTSVRFWVLVAMMVTAFTLLGLWFASRSQGEPPPLPALEAEDVVAPVAEPPAVE